MDSTGITEKVAEFAEWVKGIDWSSVGQGIKSFAEGAKICADFVGGWTSAGKLLFELWLGSKFLAVLANVTRLGVAIGSARLGWIGLLGAGSYEWLKWNADKTKGYDPGIDMGSVWGGGEAPATSGSVGSWGSIGKIFGIGTPRGIRNNNPLNLSYYPGQKGVIGSDGRFGIYGSMEEGIAQAERQLQAYQRLGLGSLAQMISKWAPPGENDTAGYIAAVSKRTGFDPNAAINMNDPAVASSVIMAMAHQETGRDLDNGTVARGLSMALGQPVGLPGNLDLPGPRATRVKIDIDNKNAPPGTTVRATSNDFSVDIGDTRISYAIPHVLSP